MRRGANLSAVDLKETGADNEVGLFEPGTEQLEDITGYITLTTFSRQPQHHTHVYTQTHTHTTRTRAHSYSNRLISIITTTTSSTIQQSQECKNQRRLCFCDS